MRLVSVRVDEVCSDRLAAEVEHDEAVMLTKVRYVIAPFRQGSVMRRVQRVEVTPTGTRYDVVDVASHSLHDMLWTPTSVRTINDSTEHTNVMTDKLPNVIAIKVPRS